MAPIYGYAPKGGRLPLLVPRKRGKNTTLLASMSLEGMGPTLAVEGATTALVFEAYVERVLAPSLRKGQVVVMDNLGADRPKRVRELIEERGCELLYLPAYSPDYNQIEETPLVPGEPEQVRERLGGLAQGAVEAGRRQGSKAIFLVSSAKTRSHHKPRQGVELQGSGFRPQEFPIS